ncbi:MAG: tetratricopeptide repeat-containing sensor histidine kinase [Bacteroidales bacterium]|nr:tetratricopeptide repeat-containing sensor histidine kinase [Bacteroidales bacterium]
MLRLVKILSFVSLFLTCNISYSEDFFEKNETNKIDSILSAIKQSQNEKEILKSLNYLSSLYAGKENFDSAHLVIDSAITIAKKSEDKYFIAKTIGLKGKLYRQAGKFENSLETLLKAYDLAKKINEKEIIMIVSNNLGVTYRRLAEDNKALEYHLEALQLAEELVDLKNIAVASNSIGIIYTYQGNYDEALPYYYKALELEQKRNNYIGIAINYNSIAWIYELKEDYKKAIEFYKKSLDANIKNNNEKGIVICYSDLGKVYHTIGEYALSLEYYKKTLTVNEKLGDKRYIARSYIYIGETYRDLGNYSQSLNNLEKGLKYAQQVNSKRLLMQAYEQLSLTFEKTNVEKKALSNYKFFNVYKDSVFNEEKSNQIIEMQTRYETNKKEQENALLKNKNSLNEAQIQRQRIVVFSIISFLILITILVLVLLNSRRKQKKAIVLLGKQNNEIRKQKEEIQNQAFDLKKAINTKNRFFSIIAHDLISPFNTLIGYSGMLKSNLNEVSKEEINEYADLIYQRSNETHELLINLLEWSLSQTQGIGYEPQEVEIKKLIKEKISLQKGQAKEKSITLEFIEGDKVLVFTDVNMLSTIIRNLVSNAIKFTKKGKVTISYIQESKYCRVIIEDTGVGISEQNLRNLFEIDKPVSTKGTAGEKGTGIGLILCKEFIKKNKGKIFVESIESVGSKFEFTIPLA